MRRNLRWAAAGLVTAALAVTAWSSTANAAAGSATNAAAGNHGVAATASGPLMQVRHTRAGTVLANSRGFTLYYYTVDKRGSGKSSCYGGCATIWPPVLGPVRIPAGVKLPGAVGYITRKGGARQLTIDGWPIYTYAGDMSPGQSNGQGVGGVWFVIKVKG
jgi:predicted lipoprotein with Yx(FWY)xxD motif